MRINITEREFHTVLAALRYWQREGFASGGHERDIATNDGDVDELNAAEIDALCERINCHAEPSPAQAPATKRFYVTMTWDDWPEGGSYGDIFEAKDSDEAERLCREVMAAARCEPPHPTDDDANDPAMVLRDYGDEWHVVDCFDLDEFIARHKRRPLPTEQPRVRMTCAECGSEDVLADAYAEWDRENQCWTVQNVMDKGHHCNNCDGECRIEEVPDVVAEVGRTGAGGVS